MSSAQSFVPSVFLLVPGTWTEEAPLRTALATATLPLGSFDDQPIAANAVRMTVVHDAAGFAGAMSRSRDGQRDNLVAAANNCTAAVLIEIGTTLDLARALLRPLCKGLRDAGGVGVRVESSGAAVDWSTWFAALEAATPSALVHHTTLLSADEQVTYTTGMHAFQRPDALVQGQDHNLLTAFCSHQVVEDPVLLTGHTFGAEIDQPARRLERWPDFRFGRDDGRHNPFGIWRIGEPGQLAAAPTTAQTIIPPLVVSLTAAEQQLGRPLTQEEVEAHVVEAPAVQLPADDAVKLERARGYADIEPSLAWQQWQIARTLA